jgi:uncharacterized protein YaiI (UPF0178 family)
MHILVDGDACPVKEEVFRVAGAHGVPVVLVASRAHVMPERPGVEVLVVDAEPQAADLAIANRARAGDVVVTGDYGLACMVLGRRARVIGFRGQRYTEGNIDGLMAQRHIHARARRGGARTRGPRAFSDEDRAAFVRALEALLGGS